jgi:NADPH-dependent F420 reductase
VLGGTGPAGSGLALRLASVGIEVTIGSRSKDRAAEVCDNLVQRWPGRDLPLSPGDNAMAAGADLVIVATPWEAAASTALSVRDQLEGKVLVSMANALAKVGDEFSPLVPPRGSVAAHVQAMVPQALVAAAFHHLPARQLAAIDRSLDSDVLVCSDHPSATRATCELAAMLPGLRPLDAGTLSNATPIEAMTAVLLQLNVRYRTRAALRITGVDPAR